MAIMVGCIGPATSRLRIIKTPMLSHSHLYKGYESMRVTSLAVGKDPRLGVGGLPLTALGLKVENDWQQMVPGFSWLPLLILGTGRVGQGCGKMSVELG